MAGLLRDTLAVSTRSGDSAYGPVFGPAVAIAASVEPGFKTITNARGEEVVSSALALVGPNATISAGDYAEWNGNGYEVIDAQPARIGGANHHIEVYLTSKRLNDE